MVLELVNVVHLMAQGACGHKGIGIVMMFSIIATQNLFWDVITQFGRV